MNLQHLRRFKLIYGFSKKRDFFGNKTIWNPSQSKKDDTGKEGNYKEGQQTRQEGIQTRQDGQQTRQEGLWTRQDGQQTRQEGLWTRQDGQQTRQEERFVKRQLFKKDSQYEEIGYGIFLDKKVQDQQQGNQQINREKIKQFLGMNDSSQKYANLIHYQSQMGGQDYEKYFQMAQQNLKQFDAEVYNEYFSAVLLSEQKQNIKQKQLFNLINNYCKYLDNKYIVMYYDLLFRTNKLPVEKSRDLNELILLVKRYNIKLTTLDISNFSYILNFELYNRYPDNYQICARVLSEYFEYICNNGVNPKLIFNLSVQFSICRTVSEDENYVIDPCLKILRSLISIGANISDLISVEDIAKWCSRYLKHENGLIVLFEVFKNFQNDLFIEHFQKVVQELEYDGSVLKCLNNLTSNYQKLQTPTSIIILEIVSLLAVKAKNWKIVSDVFQMFQSYTKQQRKTTIIYKSAIEMILQLENSTYLNKIQSLISKGQSDQNNFTRLEQDLYSIKSLIKEKNYDQAFIYFKQHIIEQVLIEYQRERIKQFLIKYVYYTAKEQQQIIDSNAIDRINKFVSTISNKILQKMYSEDASDNQILEALTFSDDPWKFWEDMKRYSQFQYLRNSILKEEFNHKLLVNIDQNNEYWSRKRYVIENYEYFMDIEKKYRIAYRREERTIQVMSELSQKYVDQFEDEEELHAKVEQELQTMLSQDIFGKMDDEFPEYASVQKIRELIHNEEQQINPLLIISEAESKQSHELTSGHIDIPGQGQNQSHQDTDKFFDQWFEDEAQFPALDDPNIRKKFIQIFYDQAEAKLDFGEDYQMNPMLSEKPYLSRFMTLQQLEEMRLRFNDAYKHGQEFVFTKSIQPNIEQQIWELLQWGVRCDEPMAIKLAEFYAEHINVVIPSPLNKIVAHYYKYQIRDRETQKKFDNAYSIIGPISIQKIYHSSDPVFARSIDYELLSNLECTFEHKGHARALLNTTYNLQKYVRYGVTPYDIIQNIKKRQQTIGL